MMRRVGVRYVAGFSSALLVGGMLAAFSSITPAFGQSPSSTNSAPVSSTSTTPASSSIVLGAANTDSAVVTGNSTDGSPTGTVTFYECGSTESAEPCTSRSNQVGEPVTVTAGSDDTSSASSASFTPTASGYWCFAGYYAGNYAGSSDTSTDECFHVTTAGSSTVTTPDSWSTSMASGTATTASGQDPNTSFCEFPTNAYADYSTGSQATDNLIQTDPVSDPTPGSECASGGPSNPYVISSADAESYTEGAPISGTNWVAPNANMASGPPASKCPAGNVPEGPDDESCNFYVYDAMFTLPSSLLSCPDLQLTGSMLADNQAGAFLNGTYIASQPGAPNDWDGENPPGTNSQEPAFTFSGSSGFVAGLNTIDFVVWDSTYANTGLDYQVTVSESGCAIASGPLGSSFDDSATVTGNSTGGSPTGTVTFYECGPTTTAEPCTSQSDQVGEPVSVTAGSGDTSSASSGEFTPDSIGYWCFAGYYSGDSNYAASSDTSTDECFDVTASTSTVTMPDSWSTSMASGTATTASGQDPNTSFCEFPTNAYADYSTGSQATDNLIQTDPVSDPTPRSECAAGSLANPYVISSSDAQDAGEGVPISGTNWVAPNAGMNSGPTASECPAGNTPSGNDSCNFYVYDATFTLPSSLVSCPYLQLTGSMLADNQAGAFLNGTYIASQPGATNDWDGENPPGTNFIGPAFSFSTFSGFVAGLNTIDFVVWDATYPSTGLDYQVTVSESGCGISSGPLGSSFDDSATVTGNATPGSPTGTVTFYVCGPTATAAPCTSQSDQVGEPVTVTAGSDDTSSASSGEFTPDSTGYWCFAGYYSGDSNYAASSDTSTDECFDVTSAQSSTNTTPASLSIVPGASNTDTAVVTGNAAGGSPTGNVTFYECGPTTTPEPCTSQANEVGTSSVTLAAGADDTSSARSISFTPPSKGYWCFAGYYSGDSNYQPSSDTSIDECFDDAPAATVSLSSPTKGEPGYPKCKVPGHVTNKCSIDILVKGAPAETEIAITECNAGVASGGEDACAERDVILLETNSEGAAKVKDYSVVVSKKKMVGDGYCAPGDTCYMIVEVASTGAEIGTLSEGQFTAASASTPSPVISKFSPTSGPVGTVVTIDGTNLENAITVTFNGTDAAITDDTATKIKVTVPTLPVGTKGKITVTTPGGQATSTMSFTVT